MLQGRVLSRETERFFHSSDAINPIQSQVDGLVSHFVCEATDPLNLAALSAGGLAYRVGRLGILNLGASSSFLRAASVVGGFGLEVGTYELTHRSLLSLSPHSENLPPNLWRWEGPQGLAQGLLTSSLTFGLLKMGGFLSREQNLIFQHAFQSSAMVGGNHLAAHFGLLPRPTGSLAEQLLHAEATNLQMSAGMGLVHSVFPHLASFERNLESDVSNPFRNLETGLGRFSSSSREEGMAFESPGGGLRGLGLSNRPVHPLIETISAMSTSDRPFEKGRGDTVSTTTHGGGDSVRDLFRILQTELALRGDVVVRYTGRGWRENNQNPIFAQWLQNPLHSLPEGKTVTLEMPHVLNTQGRPGQKVTFYWEGNSVRFKTEPLESRDPVPVSPPKPAEDSSPAVSQSLPYQVEGIPSNARVIRLIEKMESSSQGAIEAVKNHLTGSNPPPLVISFEGQNPDLIQIRIDLGRYLRELNLLFGVVIVAAFPDSKIAFRFERKGGGVQINRSALLFPHEPSKGPITADPKPEDVAPSKAPAPSLRGEGPQALVGVVQNHIMVTGKAVILASESKGAPIDLFYTGRERLTAKQVEAFQENLPGRMVEKQRFRILSTQFLEMEEFRLKDGALVKTETAPHWMPVPRFSDNYFRNWSEFIQTLVYFLPPHRTSLRNPSVAYLGDDWSDHAALNLLSELLNDHMISEGQSITIRTNRGNGEFVLERKNDRMTVKIQHPKQPRKILFLLPDLTTDVLSVQELPLGREYPYQPLGDVRLGILGTLNKFRGEKGDPLDETLVRSSEDRGRLLAEAVNQIPLAPDNHPDNLQSLALLEEIHQWIERAYASLDFETVQKFYMTVKESGAYRTALTRVNDKLPARQHLIQLNEMPTEEFPGSYVIPRSEDLRESFLRQLFPSVSGKRSPRDNLIFLRSPERLAQVFTWMFRNEMAGIPSSEKDLQYLAPQETFARFLSPDRDDLSPSLVRLRNQVFHFTQQFSEFRRILTGGKGPFHETFLRIVLYGPHNIQQSHRLMTAIVSTLPSSIYEPEGPGSLPTWEEIEAQVPPDRRKAPLGF